MIQIEEKKLYEMVMAFCEQEYKNLDFYERLEVKRGRKLTPQDVDGAAKRAFGAVMFVTNILVGYDKSLELTNWWNDYRFWNKYFEVARSSKKFDISEQIEPLFY